MREMILLAFGVVTVVGTTFFWMTGRTTEQARVVIGLDKPDEQKPSASAANLASKTQPKNPRTATKAGSPEPSSVGTDDAPVLAALARLGPAPLGVRMPFEVVKLPEFPEPRDFSKGMLRSDIERVYGKPTLSTVQTRSGRLLQRYVYVNREKTAVTVAVLEDGRVISALNMPQ